MHRVPERVELGLLVVGERYLAQLPLLALAARAAVVLLGLQVLARDEVREADILLHVVDISHPDFEEQMATVEKTLQDIGARNKPIFVIFNKIDAYSYQEYDEFSLEPKAKENLTLEELKNSWIAKEKTPCIFISAKQKLNIEKLRNDIYKMVAEIHAGRYPFNNFLY